MTSKLRITERENPASASLDTKSTTEILRIINREDGKVAGAVGREIPQIARAVDLIVAALERGGRLVYIGAGTSGRLAVLDAAECIPTFGTDRVVAVMAGAPDSMFKPAEGAEDDGRQAVRDLRAILLTRHDALVAISASGRTPYAVAGLRYARKLGAATIAVTANPQAPMRRLARVTIATVVGPEVIAGSTRMKAGTAQKLVLNMLSTASMVRTGRVLSSWMVNLKMNNEKLRKRGELMLSKATGASSRVAARALEESGRNLPVGLLMLWKNISPRDASRLLEGNKNVARMLRDAYTEWKQISRSGKGEKSRSIF
ncbi:MAG TPA: N-acetylmuramic acid 6-phosphate etherase [Terriglobia bacterium]|nr:N-acetylmuramic acid 6-phosphate etherase [Terriglobia bacterium]